MADDRAKQAPQQKFHPKVDEALTHLASGDHAAAAGALEEAGHHDLAAKHWTHAGMPARADLAAAQHEVKQAGFRYQVPPGKLPAVQNPPGGVAPGPFRSPGQQEHPYAPDPDQVGTYQDFEADPASPTARPQTWEGFRRKQEAQAMRESGTLYAEDEDEISGRIFVDPGAGVSVEDPRFEAPSYQPNPELDKFYFQRPKFVPTVPERPGFDPSTGRRNVGVQRAVYEQGAHENVQEGREAEGRTLYEHYLAQQRTPVKVVAPGPVRLEPTVVEVRRPQGEEGAPGRAKRGPTRSRPGPLPTAIGYDSEGHPIPVVNPLYEEYLRTHPRER